MGVSDFVVRNTGYVKRRYNPMYLKSGFHQILLPEKGSFLSGKCATLILQTLAIVDVLREEIGKSCYVYVYGVIMFF